METITVVIADDLELVRQSLRLYIKQDASIQLIGEAANGEELIKLCHSCPPDIAVVDIRMPVMNGIEASKVIKSEFPRTRLLILTTFDDDDYLKELLSLGIHGYLLKGSEDHLLVPAIKSIYAGVSTIDSKILKKFSTAQFRHVSYCAQLTHMEQKVAEMLNDGMYNKDIAKELNISYGRTRNIVSSIYHKLGINNRSQLAQALTGLQTKEKEQ